MVARLLDVEPEAHPASFFPRSINWASLPVGSVLFEVFGD